MTREFRHSRLNGALLNLLMPGLAHFIWGDRLFGVFVFLIMMLGAVLAATSLLLPLPTAVIWVLLGLPLVFYLFSFADLGKVILARRVRAPISAFLARATLGVGILYQLLAPTAIGNFGLRNAPELFAVADNHMTPVLRKGKLVAASSLSYSFNIPFIKKPIFHTLPERCDEVRFKAPGGRKLLGIVIGLPGESIAVDSGQILVNGFQSTTQLPNGLAGGEWPLTAVEQYAILVAVFNYGKIETAYQVSLADLVGKVWQLN